MVAADTVRHNKRLAEQEVALSMAAEGATDAEICDAIGAAHTRIHDWRFRYPDWWQKLCAVRRALAERNAVLPPKGNFSGTFIEFRQAYLGMATTWFQAKAIDAIERTRPGEVTMILWPPEHGKTTLLADYCTYKIAVNNNFRVTVASETIDHGIKILERVQNRYEPDGPTPMIHRDFGPLAASAVDQFVVWQKRRFNVAGRKIDEGDYNMAAIGIKGRVQGTRCDLLLLDDMQDLKSIDQAGVYFDLVVQSFLSRPSMFGRTVIIGTRVGEFDVYRKLMEADVVDHLVLIPAYDVGNSRPWPKPTAKPVVDDPKTWAPEGVKFLWPEKYDVVDPDASPPITIDGYHRFAYAKLRYRVGEPTWWRIYMQRPEAATSMTFDEGTTAHMLDEHRSVTSIPRRRDDGAPVPVIIGVDPALGGGNAVLAAASYPDRMEVLRCRLDYDLTKYEEIVGVIAEECHRFSTPDSVVTLVVVEDKAFQKGLLRTDSMIELQRRFGFRIVPNNTHRDKQSPDIGLPAMPLSMVRGEITIPWSDEASRANMSLLLDQLHIWRPGTRGNTLTVKKDKVPQDLPMALWFVWRRWRDVARDTTVHVTVSPGRFDRGVVSPLRRRARPTHRGYRSLRGGRR